MLSDRYYIGGTSKTEYFYPEIDWSLRVFSMTAQNGEHANFAIENVELLDNHREFKVTANYPFVWRDETWNDVSAVSLASGYSLESYRLENGYLILRMNQAYTSPYIRAEFKIRSVNRIRFRRTDWSIPLCPETTIIFDNPARGYCIDSIGIEFTNIGVNLIMKEKVDYINNPIQNINIELTPAITLTMTEVNQISNTPQEYFSMELTPAVTLNMELSGDTPV